MLLAAVLLMVAGAPPGGAAVRPDDNGPPPGSQYPPPPPLVQDPAQWQTPPPQSPPPPQQAQPAQPPQPAPAPYPATPYPAQPAPSPYPPAPAPPPYAPQPAPYPAAPPPAAPAAAPGPAPVPGGDVGARLSFGVGLHLGAAQDVLSDGSPGSAGAGLYLRLGVQFNDAWGLDGEVAGGTAVVADYVRQSITLSLTPADWFTLAIGPTLREDIDSYVQGCFGGACETTVVEAFGGTIRFDFHIGAKRTESGRSAFTLGLAADVGTTLASSIFFGDPGISYGAYLTMGYAKY